METWQHKIQIFSIWKKMMLLNSSVFTMEPLGRFAICLICLFRCFETTKISTVSFYANLRNVSLYSCTVVYSLKPAFVLSFLFRVERVLRFCRLTKIVKSIICRISIYVINTICWPFSVVHCPNNPMGAKCLVIDTNAFVPIFLHNASYASSSSVQFSRPATSIQSPYKITGSRIIDEKFMESVY
jgi:hypothetical protein